MKKIIVVVLVMVSLLFVGFNVMAFNTELPTYNERENTGLSRYVNTNIGATFSEIKTLEPLYTADSYVLGDNSKLLEEQDLKVPSNPKRDYLIKVNGEYYAGEFSLQEGVNKIVAERAYLINNTFTPTGEILEKFEITVTSPETIEKDFYYEHYVNFIVLDARVQNFTKLAKGYFKYKEELRKRFEKIQIMEQANPDNYYDKDLEYSFSFYEKEQNTNYKINLKIAKSEELNAKKVSDLNKLVDDKYLTVAVNWDKYQFLAGEKIPNTLYEKAIKVKGAEHQIFNIELTSGNIPTMMPVNRYETVLLNYTITDLVYGDKYYFTQEMLFINYKKFNSNDIEVKFDNKNNIVNVYEENIKAKDFLKDAESYLKINSKKSVYFVVDIIDVETKEELITNTVGEFELNAKITYEWLGIYPMVKINYEVKDKLPPKILAKNDVILLDNDVTYTENFRVIDNYTKSEDIDVTYKKIEENADGGIIRVTAKDKTGNDAVLEVRYQNVKEIGFFKKMLWEYREAVSNMFM